MSCLSVLGLHAQNCANLRRAHCLQQRNCDTQQQSHVELKTPTSLHFCSQRKWLLLKEQVSRIKGHHKVLRLSRPKKKTHNDMVACHVYSLWAGWLKCNCAKCGICKQLSRDKKGRNAGPADSTTWSFCFLQPNPD